MAFGYPYAYPAPYPAYGGTGIWFALLIVLFVLLLIFGSFWYIGGYFR